MSATCVVVHAEGPGDHGRPPPYAQPGHPLLEEDLGPAHELVRRTLELVHSLPPAAVDFRAPFKTGTGEALHGSRMLVPKLLDQALAGWLLASGLPSPPLVVLLVDADEEPPEQRRQVLREALVGNGLTGATGVAVQEFESWLIADQAALTQVLGPGHAAPPTVEGMSRRQAKDLLGNWARAASREGRGPFHLRCELAAAVDLDVLTQGCPSYAAFRDEVAALSVT